MTPPALFERVEASIFDFRTRQLAARAAPEPVAVAVPVAG